MKKKLIFRSLIWSDYSPDYPQELLNVMPCTYVYIFCRRYYWKKQIEIAHSQYKGFSNENLQSWLDDKKRMSNSLMNYAEQRAKQHKLKEEKPSYRIWTLIFPI